MHTHIHIHMYMYIFTYTYIHTYTHIGIRLDDTKTAPYCFFIYSKAKKLTKISFFVETFITIKNYSKEVI